MSQNYTPTEWIDNRTVGTASVMNNMEKGIEDAHDRIDNIGSVGEESLCLTNVLSLGVKNDKSVDCTDIIHKALADGKALYFPRGEYLMRYLELNMGDVLIGDNSMYTTLVPAVSNEKSFVRIAKGPVIHVRFENFWIDKSPNPGQIGIDIKSEYPDKGVQHGGLWWSTFKNIYLGGDIPSTMWDGPGMRLIGSGNNVALPIQCNTFEKVCVWSDNSTNNDNIPLIIEGQMEQNTFIRCTWTGYDYEKSSTDPNNVAAVFRRRRKDDGSIDGDLGGGSNTFIQCAIGNSYCAMSFERSRGCEFYNCYYENAHQLMQISTVSNVTVVGGSFVNTGDAEYVIEGDTTKNELYLTNINLGGKIKCKGVHMTGCNLQNDMYDERAVTNNEIKFNCTYAKIHFNHTESDITIDTLAPDYILRNDNEYYFELLKRTGKTVTFSPSSNGNIYNTLTVDIGSKEKLVKVTPVPHTSKYKIELV